MTEMSPLRRRMIEDMSVRNLAATGAIQSDAITRRISVIRRAGSDLRRLGHFC